MPKVKMCKNIWYNRHMIGFGLSQENLNISIQIGQKVIATSATY